MEAVQEKPCVLEPVGDRVCVLLDKSEETSEGGLVIVSKESKYKRGEVVALGPGRAMQNGAAFVPSPFQVGVGDKVILTEYALNEIRWQGRDYCVTDESTILAIVRE